MMKKLVFQFQNVIQNAHFVIELLEIVLKNSLMTFDKEYFQQIFGIIMGTNLAPILANLYMAMLQEELKRKCKHDKKLKWPSLFLRFIDDGFGIMEGTKKDVEYWILQFNNLRKSINIDKWSFGNHVEYMDLYIYKGEKIYSSLFLDFRIFQKEINRYMYIPQKSGHVSHTIKNYVLGELKRYIRYNSLKLTFLKIRTLFFSRLRNRGFKKIWLRKQFASLKYEDREKLMLEKVPDSTFSHSACQIVLEKKAESLRTKRNRLADLGLSHNEKTTKLFPMEPYRTKKGMFENHSNQETQLPPFKKQSNNSSNVVTQGLQREKLHPGLFLQKSASAKTAEKGAKTMAEQILEKEGRREIVQAEAEERTEAKTIYLVMPSYAEQHKHQIAAILEKEKKNLCRSKTFEKVFSSISFKIAFANSKNIKQMIVRTKI
jgi:hypothetical protein